ncbi:hypothetical protein GCM10009557_64370 [Virgisporangium ochraceum]|uniref:WD40 repeat domain-containing protein n=1 Tax=Virgisporangium ochraceum TaxID=65505 RepID=A0A8J4A3N3_9ACTN|nr:WD40 repeat domain-containing protein [Virgisporangium ochraceum]GIJ72186.1 hypothetical protein Voc01_071030 [Virgisporangium ochraceum]
MGWFRGRARATARLIGADLDLHGAMACASLNGRRLVLALTRRDGVQAIDLDAGGTFGRPIVTTQGATAMACGTLRNGHTAVVTGDGLLQAWDLDAGKVLWDGVECDGGNMVCTSFNGRPVLVVSGPRRHNAFADDLGRGDLRGVQVRDLASGRPVVIPGLDALDGGELLSCSMVDNRPVVVTNREYENLQAWDLATARPRGPLLRGSGLYGGNRAVCTTRRGRAVVVSTQTNATTMVTLDLATGSRVGPLLGGDEGISLLMSATLDRRAVVVSAHYDGWVSVWDLARGRERIRVQVTHVAGMVSTDDTLVIATGGKVVAVDRPGLGPTVGFDVR